MSNQYRNGSKDGERRRRLEQEQRRRNAETFIIQSTETIPPPQENLFVKPVRRHDEARKNFDVQLSEKILDIWKYGNLIDQKETEGFRRKRSLSPTLQETKRPKLEIPKNDPIIQDILQNVEVPNLVSPLKTPKNEPLIQDILQNVEVPDLVSPIKTPKKAANEEMFKATVDLRSTWKSEDLEELDILFRPPVLLSPMKKMENFKENEVPNRKKNEKLEHRKEFSSMSKEDKDRRSSSEKGKMPIPKMIFRIDKTKSTTEPFYTSILVAKEGNAQPMRTPALTETTLAAQPASVSSLVAADSSPAPNACCFMVMEMDADSLFERATAIKRQGDKSEANMFQKMAFYVEAAMLYLAAAVKTGPRAMHRMKDIIEFCTVFQTIKEQRSDIEQDTAQKLQAISSMILSLVHFNIYMFNFKKSLHTGIKESLTNHRMTKISSLATGAPQAAVGNNPSLISPRPSPVKSAGSTSSTDGYSAEPATGAVLSLTTSAANGNEQSAPYSSLPHSLMVEVEKYFDIIEHINKAHEIWREAKMFTRLQENLEFFAKMNEEVGAVELTSPINHIIKYITIAIYKLRKLTA